MPLSGGRAGRYTAAHPCGCCGGLPSTGRLAKPSRLRSVRIVALDPARKDAVFSTRVPGASRAESSESRKEEMR